ncbi:TonB family protein [Paracoccus sp. 11-3]|uniref:TonB family protein n=1 Tax=Paracoccus amoyensis TaxID=2760093 RepID=A0A926J7L2_9RHOB|nr:energy transducer TonB [Paracoccus amoyensis]MBC9248452.1 TonB family protein [Paracoccus amoyensis]
MHIKVFAIAAALGLSGMLAACNDGADTTESTTRPPTKPASGADWEKEVQARLDASSTRMTLLAEQQKLNPPKSAILTYAIAPNGQIKDIRIARSSGLPRFDSKALNFVATAGPLPPFSDDMARQDMQRISVVTVAQAERRWFGGAKDDKEGLLE